MLKVCTRCGQEKPLSAFHKGRAYRGGYNARCRPCRAKTASEAYLRNREAILARTRKWHQEHRQRVAELAMQRSRKAGVQPKRIFASEAERQAARAVAKRRYVARHPERALASKRAYVRWNPEKVRALLTNAKARRRGAIGELTGTQWKAILMFYGQHCARCGASSQDRPLTVDHFIPLSKGGANDWKNIWPLCLPCNVAKRDRYPEGPAPPHVDVLLRTGTFD